MELEIRRTSVLAVQRETLWSVVSTMKGVNAELMPLIRMTVPGPAGMNLEDMPLGEVGFHSWLLLGGLLPFDRHAMRLLEVEAGHRFLESSSSWLQAVWQHERRLETVAGGCRRQGDWGLHE